MNLRAMSWMYAIPPDWVRWTVDPNRQEGVTAGANAWFLGAAEHHAGARSAFQAALEPRITRFVASVTGAIAYIPVGDVDDTASAIAVARSR